MHFTNEADHFPRTVARLCSSDSLLPRAAAWLGSSSAVASRRETSLLEGALEKSGPEGQLQLDARLNFSALLCSTAGGLPRLTRDCR